MIAHLKEAEGSHTSREHKNRCYNFKDRCRNGTLYKKSLCFTTGTKGGNREMLGRGSKVCRLFESFAYLKRKENERREVGAFSGEQEQKLDFTRSFTFTT